MIYTTILHPVRKQFGISCNDYCIADMIYNLSANPAAPILGWCNASRQTLADSIGLSRRSTIDIINRLEEKGLIERQQVTDYLRTTSLWYNTVTGCKERLQGVRKVHSEESSQGVKNPHRGYAESSQEGVQKVHTIIKDNNKTNNESILAVARSETSEEYSKVLSVEAEEKKEITPVAAAPKEKLLVTPSVSLDDESLAKPTKSPKEVKPNPFEAYEKFRGEYKEGEGDGRLHAMLAEYYRKNKDKYPTEMYKAFKRYYTARIVKGKKADLGKELWESMTTWSIEGRLATWKHNDDERNGNNNQRSTSASLKPGAATPAQGRKFRSDQP